ncbi:MAG: hypothetical protein JXR05_09645 [Flavobacteriaceae bacterium]
MKVRILNRWTILLLIISISFVGCSKDDDMSILTDPVGDTDGNDGDGNNGGGSQAGTQGEITLYRVNGSDLQKIRDYQVTGQDVAYQNDVTKHQELWGLTKNVVPLANRNKMSEFMIYNGSVTGSAGYVVETKQDLSEWQMGLAINYADDQNELVYTIIHEFGHILTLNDTQVDASISSGACSSYFTGEGCSKNASYINKIFELGWKDVWSEFQQAQNNQADHQAFYEKYRDRFVTNYASTNPGEDIAEVFATFVTRNDKPTGTTIAEKKILLMYDHSELVELRNYIRTNLNVGGRSRSMLPAPGSWKKANTLGDSKHSHCKLH